MFQFFFLLVLLVPGTVSFAATPALQTPPKVAEAAGLHNNEGVQLAEQGRFREAIRSFGQAVRLVPNFASAYFNMGRAHSQLKQFDDAVRAFGTAVQVRPDYADAWYQLGIVFQTKGQFEEARKAYEIVSSLISNSPHLLYRLGFVSLKLQDWEQTATYWEQLSDGYPDHPAVGQIQQYLPRVQYNLGIVKYQNGDLSLAETAFDRAMRMQPGYAEAHYNMGLVYRDQKRFDGALAMFREAEKLNYDALKVRENIAGVYLLADSLDQAEKVYQSLGLEGSTDGYRGLVKIAIQKGELAKALVYGFTSVANMPGGDSFKLLAFVYEHNAEGKRYGPGFDADKAIHAYERGIEFEKKDVVLHFNLSIIHGRLGNWEKSLMEMKRAHKLDPNHEGVKKWLPEVEMRYNVSRRNPPQARNGGSHNND